MTKGDAQRLRTAQLDKRPTGLPRLAIRGNGANDSTESNGDELIDGRDQTELFQQVIAIIRWGVLGLLIILSAPQIIDEQDDVTAILIFAFAALTIVRHVRPIRFDQHWKCDFAILTEIGLSVAAVALTGRWESTLAVSLTCLLYTSPSPRDQRGSRMPSSA